MLPAEADKGSAKARGPGKSGLFGVYCVPADAQQAGAPTRLHGVRLGFGQASKRPEACCAAAIGNGGQQIPPPSPRTRNVRRDGG